MEKGAEDRFLKLIDWLKTTERINYSMIAEKLGITDNMMKNIRRGKKKVNEEIFTSLFEHFPQLHNASIIENEPGNKLDELEKELRIQIQENELLKKELNKNLERIERLEKDSDHYKETIRLLRDLVEEYKKKV